MGFLGDLAAIAIDVAVEGAKDAHYHSLAETRKRWVTAMTEILTQQDNLLPHRAREKAQTLVDWSYQRAVERGITNTRPIGDQVIHQWIEYCQSLIDHECVAVSEIKDLWDCDSILREAQLLREEEDFRSTRDSLAANFGLTEHQATSCAWRMCAVYGVFSSSHELDRNFTPIPLELRGRVNQLWERDIIPPWMEITAETPLTPTQEGDFPDFYVLLMVEPSASGDEIKEALKRERRTWFRRQQSPNQARRHEAENQIRLLDTAEKTLLDPAQRAAYDRELQGRRSGSPRGSANSTDPVVRLVNEVVSGVTTPTYNGWVRSLILAGQLGPPRPGS